MTIFAKPPPRSSAPLPWRPPSSSQPAGVGRLRSGAGHTLPQRSPPFNPLRQQLYTLIPYRPHRVLGSARTGTALLNCSVGSQALRALCISPVRQWRAADRGRTSWWASAAPAAGTHHPSLILIRHRGRQWDDRLRIDRRERLLVVTKLRRRRSDLSQNPGRRRSSASGRRSSRTTANRLT